MDTTELINKLNELKRNSFNQIMTSDINDIVSSLSEDDFNSLIPGINDDVDIIIFEYCFKSKKDLSSQLHNISKYLKYLNNWYDVDLCLPYIKSPIDLDFYLPIAKDYLKDPNPFVKRLGYVLFLKADLKKAEVIDQIAPLFKDDDNINVKMAEGWLLSFMYIANHKHTYDVISKSKIPYEIKRLGISKVIDSFRVDAKEKNNLKSLRVKLREEYLNNTKETK